MQIETLIKQLYSNIHTCSLLSFNHCFKEIMDCSFVCINLRNKIDLLISIIYFILFYSTVDHSVKWFHVSFIIRCCKLVLGKCIVKIICKTHLITKFCVKITIFWLKLNCFCDEKVSLIQNFFLSSSNSCK